MIKKLILLISWLTLTGLLLASCQPTPRVTGTIQPQTAYGTGLKALAAESFLADIAQNVAGDRMQVQALVPLGVDPHAFEPTPQDLVRIAESQVLIINGAGFEKWLEVILANAGGERNVIEASAGLASRQARQGEGATMPPRDRIEQLCAELAGSTAGEEIVAGSDASNATMLPNRSERQAGLLRLRLNPTAKSGYSGFVRLALEEGGEYMFAASGGTVTVTDASGAALGGEETLPMNCSGLSDGILLDLEPGEYLVTLSGLAVETTSFFAGPAGGHQESDPHFWLDPTLVVRYVENIRDGLSAIDPAGKDIYAQNAAAYIARLNELDAWIKSQVAAIPEEKRLMVTNHESFGYFADRYGFTIIGAVIPSVSTGASPSAQQMARLVDRIRETHASAIFLESGSTPKLAEQVARETGARVVSELYTHSITKPGGQAPTYIDMMQYNVKAIVEALR